MAEIGLVDDSMRDGNQSLWGATGLGTNHMLEIAGALDRVGFRAIDFTSSSHMAVAVRYFRDNPWERIRRVRAGFGDAKPRSLHLDRSRGGDPADPRQRVYGDRGPACDQVDRR